MSLESAKKFIEKMQEDKNFAKSFFSCSDREARRAFIKEKGFEFTKEEINEIKENIDVSGGKCCGYHCESESTRCDHFDILPCGSNYDVCP